MYLNDLNIYAQRKKEEDINVEKPKKEKVKKSFRRKPINQLGLTP